MPVTMSVTVIWTMSMVIILRTLTMMFINDRSLIIHLCVRCVCVITSVGVVWGVRRVGVTRVTCAMWTMSVCVCNVMLRGGCFQSWPGMVRVVVNMSVICNLVNNIYFYKIFVFYLV